MKDLTSTLAFVVDPGLAGAVVTGVCGVSAALLTTRAGVRSKEEPPVERARSRRVAFFGGAVAVILILASLGLGIYNATTGGSSGPRALRLGVPGVLGYSSNDPCGAYTVQVAAKPYDDQGIPAYVDQVRQQLRTNPQFGPLHYGDSFGCGESNSDYYFYVGPFVSANEARSMCFALGAVLAEQDAAFHDWPFYRDQAHHRAETAEGNLDRCEPGHEAG